MRQEPLTLDKLIVLYFLDRISFSPTVAQIGDFIQEKEYMNYLTLQQTINDLTGSGLILARKQFNRTQVQITPEGRDTLFYLQNHISAAVKTDILDYLSKNSLRMRNEASVQSNYKKLPDGSYETELNAADRDTRLISISLTVPDEALAVAICENWQKRSTEIYQYLTTALF